MKVVKSNNNIQLLKNHLAITKSLLPAVSDNLFLELLDKENIIKAINLAINARLNLDPYFHPEFLEEIKSDDFISMHLDKIKHRLQNNDFEGISNNITIPKNRFDNRIGNYVDIETYIFKFLVAYILHKHVEIPSSVFGGKDEIFEIVDHDVFKLNNSKFVEWQSEQFYEKNYQYVAVIDVKNYYATIQSDILIKKISNEIKLDIDSDLITLIKSIFSKLTIGSWPDHFIQNFYLKELDLKLSDYKDISYGRLTDDIRIFANTEQDAKACFDIVIDYFKLHKLTINMDKAFVESDNNVIETFGILHKNEIQKFEFENLMKIHSTYGNIYSTIDIQELPRRFFTYKDYLNGKDGYYVNETEIQVFVDSIIENSNISVTDINNLFNILKHFYGNYRFYRTVIDAIFSGIENNSKSINELILQSTLDFLGQEQLKSTPYNVYRSYLLIRKIFFDVQLNDHIYKRYLDHSLLESKFHDVIANGIILLSDEFTFKKPATHILKKHFHALDNDQIDSDYWINLINNALKNSIKSQYYESDMYMRLIQTFSSDEKLLQKYISALHEASYPSTDNYKALIDCINNLFKISFKPSYLFNRAYAYFEIGIFEKSIEDYNQYLSFYSNSTSALNNRALAKEKVKDFTGALADYSRALELKPNNELYMRNKQALIEKINKAD